MDYKSINRTGFYSLPQTFLNMKYYQNQDIQITNNPYINSPLQIANNAYFDWSVSYPDGKIRYDVEFWQEIDGQKLDYNWHRTFEMSINYDVSSQKAAEFIFFNMVPQLAPYQVENNRRFVGLTEIGSKQKARDLVNEVKQEDARFDGWYDAGPIGTTDVTHLLWRWVMTESEIDYLVDKFGLEHWQLINYLDTEYNSRLFEVPPNNEQSALWAMKLDLK